MKILYHDTAAPEGTGPCRLPDPRHAGKSVAVQHGWAPEYHLVGLLAGR